MCDYGGVGGLGGGGMSPGRLQMGIEDDREVKEKAREALHWWDHHADMTMSL